MSPEHLAIVMFAGVLVLVLAGVPLYISLAVLGLAFGILGGWAPQVYTQFIHRIFGLMASEVLPAVPLFVFMGAMLERSGASDRLYGSLYLALGGLRGGLALVTIMICTLFAACTGVIGASVTTMGLLALPAMLKRNYDIPLATGTICAGGTLGILIPPSVLLLLYGPMANVSVAKLFTAAIVPGLVLSGLYLVYVAAVCIIKPKYGPPIPVEERKIPKLKLASSIGINLVPPLFLILAVLGSIFFGIAAPTEAASLGGFGAVVIAAAYRRLNWKNFYESAKTTLRITSMVMFVACGATLFSGVFMALGGAKLIGSFLLGLPFGKWGIVAVMMVILIALGMFIDWIGILYIIIPIFTPVAAQLGFDPLWWAMIVAVNMQTCFLTPPFAYSMFYLKGVAPPEVTMSHIYRGVIPFLLLQFVGIAVVIIFPQISLWLPSLMYK